MSHFLRFNSHSSICYMEDDLVVCQFVAITDAAFFGKFDSIPDQIRNHLKYPVFVCCDHQALVRRLVDKAYFLRNTEYMGIAHFQADVGETGRSERKFNNSRFNLREIEDLVDKLQKPFVVAINDVVIFFAFFRIVAFGNEI